MLNSEINNTINNKTKIQEITYLLEELDEKSSINIQNAKERQIININNINIEIFNSFEILINGCSKRKIFDNNLNINYDKYNEFEINYELIEELLRKTLLYGKRQFNNSFNYIIYQAEADEMFSSNLNELISKCDGKYEELNEEKQLKINQFEDLSNILNSLDQLIFYVNHSNQKDFADFPIQDFLSNARKVAKFSGDFEKLINDISFKVKELAPLYDYIEEKTFKEIKEIAKKQEYMKDLHKGAIGNLIRDDLKEVFNNNKLINKEQLLRALRKFTIKNLLIDDQPISSDERLLEVLLRDEGLWLYKQNPVEAEKERKEDMDKIKNVIESEGLNLIMVKHTILFYEVLSGDKDIEKKYKDKTKDEDDNRMSILI